MSNDDSHDNIRVVLNGYDDHSSLDIYRRQNDELCDIDWHWHAAAQYFVFAYQGMTYKAHSVAEMRDVIQLLIPDSQANTINILFVLPDMPNILIEDGICLRSSSRTPRIMQGNYFRPATCLRGCIGATPTTPLPTDASIRFADILRVHVPILQAHYDPMVALRHMVFYCNSLEYRYTIPSTQSMAVLTVERLFLPSHAPYDVLLTLYGKNAHLPVDNIHVAPTPAQIHAIMECVTDSISVPNHVSQHQYMQHLHHIRAIFESDTTTMPTIIHQMESLSTQYYTFTAT